MTLARAVASRYRLASVVSLHDEGVDAGPGHDHHVLVQQQTWTAQCSYLASPVLAAVVLTMAAIALAGRLTLAESR